MKVLAKRFNLNGLTTAFCHTFHDSIFHSDGTPEVKLNYYY